MLFEIDVKCLILHFIVIFVSCSGSNALVGEKREQFVLLLFFLHLCGFCCWRSVLSFPPGAFDGLRYFIATLQLLIPDGLC